MALVYNQPRFAQKLLTKYKNCLPSFTVNLYDDHWTLNKGPSKFLYTQPVSTLLEDVRALRIPVDFIEIFDMANVPYYEGCMIVETTDHRKPLQQQSSHSQQSSQKEPEPMRVVLHPNAETLYADLCLLNAKHGNRMTDMDALEIESKILTATLPPLTLEPDLCYTRIVNHTTRKTTPIETKTRKRKQVHEPEEDESDKAKRAKLWSQYMHPHNGKPTTLTGNRRSIFDILNEVAEKDEKGGYKSKLQLSTKEAGSIPPSMPPPPPRPAPTPVSQPAVQAPAMPNNATVKKVDPPKKTEFTENSAAMIAKAKMGPPQIPHPASAAPVPTPSPANEATPTKMAPPPVRTPVISTVASSPVQHKPPIPQPSVSPHTAHPPPAVAVTAALNQAQKKTVTPKKEEQQQMPTAVTHPLPQTRVIPPEMQGAWKQQAPSPNYLSQPPPPKNKPAVQSSQPQQQISPYPARPALPGYVNTAAYPPGAAAMYKNVQAPGMVHNPNPNVATRSPMSYPQPLMSREPLRTHSQSPHPPQQQQSPVQASSVPQQQMPRPTTQQQQLMMQARYNAAMQGQSMSQHNVQQQNAARAAVSAHDPTQPGQQHMMQMPYNVYQYPTMHMPGMVNGMRMANMPGVQGAAGQYMAAASGWGRAPAGRGTGPPVANMPLHTQQQYQQQQFLAAAMRAQQHQQHQLQTNQQHQGNVQR